MIINRSKTVLGNLVDLIKESNPHLTALNESQLIPGTPSADGTVANRNSKVTVWAVANAGFSGSRDLWYNRCSLTQGITSPITSISRQPGETAAQVGLKIIQALNIKESEVVINAGDGWTLTGNQVITSKADSLIYLPGQSHTVNVIAPSILGSITFNSAFLDSSFKWTSYSYGFSRDLFGSVVTHSGFVPAAPSIPSTFAFVSSYDQVEGWSVRLTYTAGALSIAPNVARVYRVSDGALIATFTGGVVSTAPDASFNAIRFPGGLALPTGIQLRVDFSIE